jgi:hypothetical protein
VLVPGWSFLQLFNICRVELSVDRGRILTGGNNQPASVGATACAAEMVFYM